MSRSARDVQGCCLGDVAAALVDGELDHASRERAHRHLAHCAGCRAEVDGQRRLKARLAGVEQVEASSALTERLLRIAAPVPEPSPDVRPPSRPATVSAGPAAGPSRPAAVRRGGARPGPGRPGGARTRRPARRRTTTGSAIVLLGVAAALALGAPQPRPSTTPVDPASDAFVAEFVSTPADSPGSAVARASTRTAGVTTFVPLTGSALLSTGGARTTR
jgi:hypothetical protein